MQGATMALPEMVPAMAERKNRGTGELIAAVKQCRKVRDLESGRRLHLEAVAAGAHTNGHVAATLIAMYGNCRRMPLAREVFEGMAMAHRGVVAWNALIRGYVHNGESLLALDLFAAMDCEPDAITYIAVIKACGSLASEKESVSEKQSFLDQGIAFHKLAEEQGFASEVILANSLVDMYSKCGSIHRARAVFDRMVAKNVITWTTLILGYVQNGESLVGLDLFDAMDCEPNQLSYVAALKACGALAREENQEKQQQYLWLEKGISIHKQVTQRGLDTHMFVASALVHMYSNCGRMDHARKVFDKLSFKDVVVWSTLIQGYQQNGDSSLALDLFTTMDCEPNRAAIVAALKACALERIEVKSSQVKAWCLNKGIAIHKQVQDRRLESDFVVGCSLVKMYCECGSMDRARGVFDRMKVKSNNTVPWNYLIAGYVQNGDSWAALDLFSAMECEPDSFTYVALLNACGSLAALEAGQEIHSRVCKAGMDEIEQVGNALVDFYGKCGRMSRAEEVFNNISSPDIVSWCALITGYSSAGASSQVFSMVKKMREARVEMHPVTFICILTACSQAGLVEQGRMYFKSMPAFGVVPDVEHYTCMVDMLGRDNRLHEALALIQSMPMEAKTVTWLTFLGACNRFKNLELGKVAFDTLVAAGSTDATPYVLMSGIYKSLNMWREMEQISLSNPAYETSVL